MPRGTTFTTEANFIFHEVSITVTFILKLLCYDDYMYLFLYKLFCFHTISLCGGKCVRMTPFPKDYSLLDETLSVLQAT